MVDIIERWTAPLTCRSTRPAGQPLLSYLYMFTEAHVFNVPDNVIQNCLIYMLSDILINNGVSFLEFLVITAYMFKVFVYVSVLHPLRGMSM